MRPCLVSASPIKRNRGSLGQRKQTIRAFKGQTHRLAKHHTYRGFAGGNMSLIEVYAV